MLFKHAIGIILLSILMSDFRAMSKIKFQSRGLVMLYDFDSPMLDSLAFSPTPTREITSTTTITLQPS